MSNQETIVAIATPPGRGGIGIVRVSGSLALTIAEAVLGKTPTPRYAHYGNFFAENGQILDQGIALFFPTLILLQVKISLNCKGMAALLFCNGF